MVRLINAPCPTKPPILLRTNKKKQSPNIDLLQLLTMLNYHLLVETLVEGGDTPVLEIKNQNVLNIDVERGKVFTK